MKMKMILEPGVGWRMKPKMNRNMEVPGGGRRRREKFHRVPSFRTGKASKAVNPNSNSDCAVSVYQAGVCHGALVHGLSKSFVAPWPLRAEFPELL